MISYSKGEKTERKAKKDTSKGIVPMFRFSINIPAVAATLSNPYKSKNVHLLD